MAILKNTLNNVVLHFTANSGNVIIAGNSGTSNVAYSTQTVTKAEIRQILCSSNNVWTIKRGEDVVWHGAGNFHWNFAGHNVVLNQNAVANLSVEIAGGVGSIIVEMSKESA